MRDYFRSPSILKAHLLAPAMNARMAVFAAVSLLLFSYVAIRAHQLSFTHDESLSFTITEGEARWAETANNHLLNTALMARSKQLFGASEWALRLPNVLSFLVYLVGCYFLLKTAKSTWLFIGGVCLFLLNPFLLEFFSLARGYGMSIGCMMLSLHFLLKEERADASPGMLIKDFACGLVFASCALLANLTLINYVCALVVVFGVRYVTARKRCAKKRRYDFALVSVVILSGVPILWALRRLFLLKEKGELYFGEADFSTSIESIIAASIYVNDLSAWIVPMLQAAIVPLLIAGGTVIGAHKTSSKRTHRALAMLILISGLTLVEAIFLEAKYPSERAALFYLPLFSTFCFFLFGDLAESFAWTRRYGRPVALCLIGFLCANFFAGMNVTYTRTWRYDSRTKEAMALLRDDSTSLGRRVTVSNHWLFEPTMNYYIATWKLPVAPANRNGVSFESDFVYALGEHVVPSNYEELIDYADVGSRVLKKVQAPNR